MATTFDAHANLASAVVDTPPSPDDSGTSLVVAAGHGARFPAADGAGNNEFMAVIYPDGDFPTLDNAEVVRVTEVATDTLTIVREQESTTAINVAAGNRIMGVLSSAMVGALETVLNAAEDDIDALQATASALSPVATSGDYDDLSNTPTLGTAAAEDVDFFATGAEGDLAATALQPGDGTDQLNSATYDGTLVSASGTALSNAMEVIDEWGDIVTQDLATVLATADAYSPAATGNWTDVGQPSDQDDALDRLASRSASALAPVATSGDYDDLSNPPTPADIGAAVEPTSVLDALVGASDPWDVSAVVGHFATLYLTTVTQIQLPAAASLPLNSRTIFANATGATKSVTFTADGAELMGNGQSSLTIDCPAGSAIAVVPLPPAFGVHWGSSLIGDVTATSTVTPGNLVSWNDTDVLEDAGVAASDFASKARLDRYYPESPVTPHLLVSKYVTYDPDFPLDGSATHVGGQAIEEGQNLTILNNESGNGGIWTMSLVGAATRATGLGSMQDGDIGQYDHVSYTGTYWAYFAQFRLYGDAAVRGLAPNPPTTDGVFGGEAVSREFRCHLIATDLTGDALTILNADGTTTVVDVSDNLSGYGVLCVLVLDSNEVLTIDNAGAIVQTEDFATCDGVWIARGVNGNGVNAAAALNGIGTLGGSPLTTDPAVLTTADAYTPAATGDWTDTGQPSDQDDALDKLASRDADAYTPAASADWNAANQPTGQNDALDILADRSTAAIHVLTYNGVDDYEPLNGAEIPDGAPRRFVGNTDPASAGGGSWSLVANVDEWLDTTA